MFIVLGIATVILAVFAFLFLTAGENSTKQLQVCLLKNQIDIIKSARIDIDLINAKVSQTEHLDASLRHEADPRLLKRERQLKKKMIAAKKQVDAYQKNGIGLLDLAPLAGYRVLELFGIDINNKNLNALYKKCLHFKNDQEAMLYANYLMSSLIGNLILAAMMLFLGFGLGIAMGLGSRAIIVGIVFGGIFALLGYIPYDEVNSTVAKRTASIERDFPRVVSKLTLLAVSGIDISHAWDITSKSDTGTLYSEMCRVTIDMENNISGVEAYSSFIKRCDYGFTTKLATALMQNMTKGNSQIVSVLKNLNTECWSEYKHTARRKGEKISSKLLIPTMLLFAGILIMVIVPAFSGFNF